ncbi:MAG: hypothetical protein EBR01_12610 [Proteobacteria bacterium]|nr:hypothetical protein [Pseudomonadota bacterium]
MERIEKKVGRVCLQVTFQFKNYINLILASTFFAGFAYLITLIPLVGGFGYILYLVVIFKPALVGFDCFALYDDKFKIPKLLHPQRFLIAVLNLLSSLILIISIPFFILVWILLLAWALKPGFIEVEKIEYTSIFK